MNHKTNKDDGLKIRRQRVKLTADPSRVITRMFMPGGEVRACAIVNRVLGLADAEVSSVLAKVMKDFSQRHADIRSVFRDHFEEVSRHVNGSTDALTHLGPDLPEEKRFLIGAYFTMEYALESVALFNPSIVPHPDQKGLPDGATRFIMSLRACGEGHISSIEFRTGIVDGLSRVTFDPPARFASSQKPVPDKRYERYTFFLKLVEMGSYNEFAETILRDLSDCFTLDDLERTIEARRQIRARQQPTERHSVADVHGDLPEPLAEADAFDETVENLLWLACSNYSLKFPAHSDLSSRVIFPVNENESRGIEDARFVRFEEDDGSIIYYATYTAYNGFRILPQLMETTDFQHFHIATLNGRYAQNKGMAMFPRKVHGEYMMLSRVDGENLYLMTSDNPHFWNEAGQLRQPTLPWEFMQIGNCGSPLETPHGWLVLTHGVGPMRQYCIGAMLLDLEDPSQAIGHLDQPILVPNAKERDGYVPNVVYSCGAMIHHGVNGSAAQLIMPYAMSDSATSVATIDLAALLAALKNSR